jgi:hypothetical protein
VIAYFQWADTNLHVHGKDETKATNLDASRPPSQTPSATPMAAPAKKEAK